MFFNISLKDIWKCCQTSRPNCYGFATKCHKLHFYFIMCRKPTKIGNH